MHVIFQLLTKCVCQASKAAHIHPHGYPSLRNDRWCNFAIHPRFADKLAQHCVLACRWIGSNIEIHHTGVAQVSGELQWRPTTRDDWEQFNSVYSNLTR